MGKVLSLMGRPLRNYNIENRAHKIISKEKPTPAPKHKSDQIDYERMMKEYPEAFEESQQKHEQLNKYLRDVYVQSHDPVPTLKPKSNPDRPLPVNKSQVEDFEYGVKEPERVPEGRTTLRNALKFITDHHKNPRLHSAEQIAKEYAIPEETINNVLNYFKVYEIYVPEQRKVKAKFAGPSVPRIKVITHPKKQLAAAKGEKDNT
ncbi:protein NDUFAF4 homolog [Tenebrio molitor]|jgi:NADH dehydrogenase [ubiquinone] 1 alpha subcomplex assembly factor 4|uniref:protein NDUFAF4 homolog n=1 Tax=Tenebrio molitor TaxID=7067 RepID=UPI001C3AC6A2|nr:unnamed protein product [Tenebrio molitor]